ncbi:glycosyltransferase [Lichenihabitans sp. Uapishka_5]|uniref:glycosyltransferase family protein n=1 Tax=Lichenihabitans sp. Uapishka_5 TaxID=3037302 RepID=UPI0029E7CC61|nr:glycosyltransferase [Lichenihabitans sp. Uapishka_5]MDX7950625.1 glycosyltransferase [Lichenihabitans sp. Uapishka_5]
MAERPLRASLYVQHLLGIGHLARTFRIADALVVDGWDVEVLVGGALPAGFATGRARIVALPPVRAAAGGLSRLVHPDGRPFEAADQAARRDALLAHVVRHRPDALLIEAFPFGRRQMRFELIPLLEAVRAWAVPPRVAASVRDILQENHRPERVSETVATIARFVDSVLVHGDPALARLGDSFPGADAFADKIAYTGLVAPPRPTPVPMADRYDVVVSVGGGAVGASVLRTAIEARARSAAADARWLVLAGPNASSDTTELAGPGVTVARMVPDLAAMLATARLSISQAGYNTVADILVAGCRAVLVPYAEDGETEQTVRATMMARHGRAIMVPERDLGAETLATAIDAALEAATPALNADLAGAPATASLLRRMVRPQG